jgi:hypothetical protein
MSTRRLAAFQAIGHASQDLLDLGQQAIDDLERALDLCRAELTAIEELCRGAGLEGSVLSMVQTLARSHDAERVLREAHKVTVAENAKLRVTIADIEAAFAVVDDEIADGNARAWARQRIRDALKGKVTT